jgi:hypothetical protein
METLSPPQPAIDPPNPLYYHLVYTLTDLLPPPLDDSPDALHDRNHAAIAKVAALRPVNANEADLAASASPPGPRPRTCCACCVSTRATSGWCCG